MPKTTVEVRYKRKGGANVDLDNEIRKFFESLGFKCIGQGFDYEDRVRDIEFEKEQLD